MRIAGKKGFGHRDFDSNLLVDGLHGKEIVCHRLLFVRIVPLPATLVALDEDSGVVDGETIDEFGGQMFVEDEDLCEEFITGEMVDFPYFTMCAGKVLAGFNQFQ